MLYRTLVYVASPVPNEEVPNVGVVATPNRLGEVCPRPGVPNGEDVAGAKRLGVADAVAPKAGVEVAPKKPKEDAAAAGVEAPKTEGVEDDVKLNPPVDEPNAGAEGPKLKEDLLAVPKRLPPAAGVWGKEDRDFLIDLDRRTEMQ